MATIDEELAQLERDIRQLKIEYDMFFGGGRKRPPTEIEWRIELIVKRYAERGGDLKFGQRFRFNNLSQTYAKYKDVFRKRMAQREEGTVQRHFGAAAKAIEAERSRAQAEAPQKGTPSAESAPTPAAVAAASAEARSFRVAFSEPENESQKVDQLFEAFRQAKQQAGEETAKLTRAGFNEFVRKKTKDLQSKKNCRDVEYVVETVDGQVKLKALVKS
ncbi:MAG TPA: MXAN_5187 C-terminal domain-containing protein [Dongiaceae bacterium]|nr:MXAN_5187 C-terminal domain-containing protein [Dongiaceae bacterium]